jgi:endonuclease/exonuclease/phosphatase family metal-dependent hydrolase
MTRVRLGLALAVLVGASLLVRASCSTSVRIATFNIEMFPDADTSVVHVAHAIAQTNADVIAVQEIRSALILDLALAHASTFGAQRWRSALAQCGRGTWLTTGVVYDDARWDLVLAREYPGLERDAPCLPRTMSGMLAVLDDGDARIAVLSVHLPPMPWGYEARTEQWRRALTIATDVERELGIPVAILGDMNTTGWGGGDPPQEPEFVRGIVGSFGFDLHTGELACSEYWLPKGSPVYRPSLLDHIVTRGGQWDAPQVLGHCGRLMCAPTPPDRMDPDYFRVSDHCPVVLDGEI